ncbi:hypothetical protein QTO34_017340 [Cnephaeus nilssonii]|uniref:Cullin-associated NEDD8-dissociated protein 1 n=1 Tax=Cnephaeus nilssonii TaxID=3371016 RepID=A0AA40I1K8_CNENI|nr:hypothetical protein QTO34_017340 [Eptesicus nilssonii]
MGKQRISPPRKEKQASPEKEVNELEANNLSEKEFREMVIRWLKRMEDKFDNMSKNQEEMKKNQEEMKNDIAAVKNSIESIKSRLEEAEDRISELEDKMEKNTQLQQLLETKIRKHEESLRELRDNTKQNNIRIIGVPEGKETEQGIENLLEEIITENFLDIGKKKPTKIQEAHRVPSKMNPKRPTPRHIIIKLANTNDKAQGAPPAPLNSRVAPLSGRRPSKVGELGACLLRHQRTGTQIHREKRKRVWDPTRPRLAGEGATRRGASLVSVGVALRPWKRDRREREEQQRRRRQRAAASAAPAGGIEAVNMASASYHISNLLEKMTSSDKDFRTDCQKGDLLNLKQQSKPGKMDLTGDEELLVWGWFMATNDLMTELQKDSIKLDDDSERKVVKMILKLLEDKKESLGPLVSKVKEYQVETIVDTLCTNMLSDKEQLRDISSIGLKTVIGELPPASSGSALAANVCKKITGRLTSAIAKQEDVSVQLEALDIMADMLSRQGGLLVNFHPSILTCLLPQLTSPRLAVRKRTIIALGHLVMSCGNIVFVDLIEHLLSELSKNDSMSTTRTYIQCIAAISRQAGHRIGEYLEKIIPLVVKFCNVDDDELREYCIQAFESFVRRIDSVVAGSDDEYSDDDDMSWKVRRAAAKCLDAVVSTRHEMLAEFYKTVSPALISRFKEREENVKADVFHAYLSLLKQTRPVQSWLCDPDAMEQGETPLTMLQSQALVPPVVACVGDPFYKITSEALLVTQQLVKVIRPLDQPSSFDATPYIKDLFTCTIKRLKAADIDQEVKERAISCMGQIICNLGDNLGSDLPNTLQIFLERLKNEITRLTTVKALTLIAGSPLKIDLRPVLGEGVPILASFLRKNQRALKLGTLSALDILIKNYSDSLTTAMIDAVLDELPPLISESDMHVSQMAISFLTTLAKVYPSSLSKISGSILNELIGLVRSPLLQGGALSAMLDFFQALVVTGTNNLGYMDLLRMLTGPVYSQSTALTHKQSYYSIAKCVAALTRACPKEGPAVVGQFIQDVKNSRSTDSIRLLALLSLGEVGHHIDLSGQLELKSVILEAFSSPSEEVKSAASYALGSISVGNLPEYLPFVLQEITSQPKRQYLLLHSLKEIISSASVVGLKPYVENIWALLLKHCECAEEGTRNVVAECLGKLTLIDPETLLPRLKGYLISGSSYARSSVVTAVKFTISDHPQPIDPLLKNCIGDFLKTLEDPDLNVRRVALVTFNSAAHNKPSLIRDLLDTVLPHLYNETKVRKELIREVEMGPFKHTVDDGLDIRKAAFECMYTLLDSCLDRLDIFEFLNHVEDGLKDHYDIKVKANSVKQEFEKQDELKRSAMRAVAALLTIPEAEKSPLMSEFQSQISSNPELAAIFESIQKDSSSTNLESMDTS